MTRLPFPEEVSLADAMAFDDFTPEQKRIAVAGVAIQEWLQDRMKDAEEDARLRGYEQGHVHGLAERRRVLDEPLHHILDRLALLRQKITTADSRYTELGEIIGDLTKLVVPT